MPSAARERFPSRERVRSPPEPVQPLKIITALRGWLQGWTPMLTRRPRGDIARVRRPGRRT